MNLNEAREIARDKAASTGECWVVCSCTAGYWVMNAEEAQDLGFNRVSLFDPTGWGVDFFR